MALHPCKECGQQISCDAKVCPHCGKKQGLSTRSGCLILFCLLAVLVLIWAASLRNNEPTSTATNRSFTDSKGRPVPPGITNDAELLIARCGPPSSDVSSANDNPRPPVPIRIVEYRRHRLRFMFVPGGNTRIGGPPPYQWRFFGITDMRAADPSHAKVVSPSEAARRMPCWAGK